MPTPRRASETSEEDKEYAAFPAGRLRHFQKMASVKEELKSGLSTVQVEVKLSVDTSQIWPFSESALEMP